MINHFTRSTAPTPTPMRTPSSENVILQEARNLAALRNVFFNSLCVEKKKKKKSFRL